MVFSSSIFLCFFLPAFLWVYFLIPYRFKNYWILLSSVLFYAWGAPKFILIVLAVLAADYYLGNKIYENEGKRKKLYLILSIILNLGLLFYFKYFNFFMGNVSAVLVSAGMKSLEWTKVILPIGISFFVFQEMSYTIDIYRGEHKPLKKFSDYMLFIFLFSHLIAGPIVTYNVLADDIVDRRKNLNNDYRLLGFFRFIIGLSRKVLIANPLGLVADHMFNGNLASLSAGDAWLGIIAYTFQLYFDFAGYSDMAIGLGKMMGFNFPENFDSPYISQNITEFWRRWHITLGSWMRRYLYIPLGGNRISVPRTYLNLWIVFILSGFWHGASWNFLVWGCYHGLFIVIDKLFWERLSEKLPRIINVILTFFIVAVGWIFFRADTTPHAIQYVHQMFCGAYSFDYFLEVKTCIVLALAVAFSFGSFWPFVYEKLMVFYKTVAGSGFQLAKAVVAIVLFYMSMAEIVSSGFNPFIYFRF
ncbi:MAG: hypothetical protein JWO03_3680 [Bacteroidetes bacterium]|nr:hypothetical protein [Bacteroidota bacterium]